ncbi:thiamine-phosphate kinase [Nonomuraea sp. NPDC048826]|uniref:thiamine-phosphate kinase n=1 Tax=Nonomuraea sp. NPDC048826 TaxID=3364347 RepID=UPI003713BC08
MVEVKAASDEPTRLAEIIHPLFADQARGWSSRLDNGSSTRLLAGVPAQDDCAVFGLLGDQELVLGSDYVRGPKFQLYELGHLNEYDIGYYLAIANFSDIAAMGAHPIALLSVIRYPKNMPDDVFSQVIEGVRDACASVGAPNVGGDIGTAERLILSASAMGVVEPGRSLRRNGARPGDLLYITGPTGIAAAAQLYFSKIVSTGATRLDGMEEELIGAWKRPKALVRHGRCLSRSGVVTSCQDSSDGLKAGIQTIATLSGVGFLVEEDTLPIADVVAEVAKLGGADPVGMVLGDSVDFQLVFTVAAAAQSRLEEELTAGGLPFHRIGVATEDRAVMLRRLDGLLEDLPGVEWRHST